MYIHIYIYGLLHFIIKKKNRLFALRHIFASIMWQKIIVLLNNAAQASVEFGFMFRHGWALRARSHCNILIQIVCIYSIYMMRYVCVNKKKCI